MTRERAVKLNPRVSKNARIIKHAGQCMWWYRDFAKRADASDRPEWAYLAERQCWRDVLESLFQSGLIDDYHLGDGTFHVGGRMYKAANAK